MHAISILAIWFYPGSTRLYIRVATTANPDDGFDSTIALPLNAKTNVRFEAVGRELKLFLNKSVARNCGLFRKVRHLGRQ